MEDVPEIIPEFNEFYNRKKVARKIFHFLKENKPKRFSRNELISELNTSPTLISLYLNMLCKDGLIKKEEDSRSLHGKLIYYYEGGTINEDE